MFLHAPSFQSQLKEHRLSYDAASSVSLSLSALCPSLSLSPFSPSFSFVCFWDVGSDKTLGLTGLNLQFRHGTCGLFMCLTCHCFCKAWWELIESVCVSVCVDLLVRFELDLYFCKSEFCTQTQGWRRKRQMSEWKEGRCSKWDNSRVAEVPAEIAVCEGKQRAVGRSQGYPVDVGPRLGTEAGVEVIRHAVCTSDPGRVTKEPVEWKLTSIQAWKAGNLSSSVWHYKCAINSSKMTENYIKHLKSGGCFGKNQMSRHPLKKKHASFLPQIEAAPRPRWC